MKRQFLKNTPLLIALVVVVYLVANYSGNLKSEVLKTLNIPGSSVQGASTDKAKELSEKFSSDIASQFGVVQGQLLNLKVSDAINGFARLQKIPQDIKSIEQYLKAQAEDVLKSEK